MSSRTFSARVMRFRVGVYAARGGLLTAGCQLLLLRLSDDMNANAIVSVPRSRLAQDLRCPPARITEWISQAVDAGYLTQVRRARPNVTAVYQGHVVNPEVRPGVPVQRYGETNPNQVRPGVPLAEPPRYAQQGSQEVVATGTDPDPTVSDVGIEGRAIPCGVCEGSGCSDCDGLGVEVA